MKIIRDIKDYKSGIPTALTIGTYDGVHIGHQVILDKLLKTGKERDLSTTVVTFDPHPKQVVATDKYSDSIQILSTLDEKIEIFTAIGIDTLIVIPFTIEFSKTNPEIFVRDVLCKSFGAKAIIVGYDHNFGKDREGNSQTLKSLGNECGFTVEVADPVSYNDEAISSTRIRKLLIDEGDVKLTGELLKRNYSVSGEVVKGKGIGRSLNFPTANISVEDKLKIIPKNGVYCVDVFREGVEQRGMSNIGMQPTFNGDTRTLEVHILMDDLDDMYGEIIKIEFISRIRDEQKFDSPDELVVQLEKDKIVCSV